MGRRPGRTVRGELSVRPAILPAMAYDTDLADRIRAQLSGESGVSEMRMFGGLAFLINGHMAVAVSGAGGLMLRCPPSRTESLLTETGAHPLEMRGREMAGWLRVDADDDMPEPVLARWVGIGREYARSLPPK